MAQILLTGATGYIGKRLLPVLVESGHQVVCCVRDLKRFNIRVSLVSPGFIKTPMTDKNDFPMPMIKSPEFAADQMFKGLTKNKGFEIHFPKSFTSIMKVLKVMPNGLYFRIIEKGMKKIVD